jgi:hypothetical protein
MDFEPAAFVWDGTAMIPLDRFRALCRRQFRPGGEYSLHVWRGRSDQSHKHYFACIRTGFDNLPEKYAGRFLSPEHLRKRCLVWEGYADHTEMPCIDEDQLSRMVTLVRKADPYAVMKREGLLLHIWTAQSQDHASMGHEAFQRSKDAVLGRIANMCGISVVELTKNAKDST